MIYTTNKPEIMKISYFTALIALFAASVFAKDYVDYVNCKMGGVSHVLVPARETVQLPNSMMRAFAFKFDSAAVALHSLPLFVHSHRFFAKHKTERVYKRRNAKSPVSFRQGKG